MAGIDKIYGTQVQYEEFLAWAQTNKPSITRYFYPEHGYKPGIDRPITNFPTEVDVWLWAKCPLEWVKKELLDQYGGEPPELLPSPFKHHRPPKYYGTEDKPWNVSKRDWAKRLR